MIRLIEIPMALFLMYLAYTSLFPAYQMEKKKIPYNTYYTLVKELIGIFSVYANEGNLLGIQQILEETLEKKVDVDFLLYIPFKVINTENITKHCVLGFIYDIGDSTPESVKVIKGEFLKTTKRKNWRKKIVVVNASPGCFKLNLYFPSNLNLSCLRAFFKEKYELTIGWDNGLIVCSPFDLNNQTLTIYYCLGNTVAESHLKVVSQNVVAEYIEVSDANSSIVEIYFETDISPGENNFILSFGKGEIPLYQNETLTPNCTLPIIIPDYSYVPPIDRDISGQRIALPIPFLYGLLVLYITFS